MPEQEIKTEEPLALITEDGAEPEIYPEVIIAGGNPGERFIRYFITKEEAAEAIDESINWYIGEKPPYRYPHEGQCFYCGAPRFTFKVERLTDGKLIGYPVCKTHSGEVA